MKLLTLDIATKTGFCLTEKGRVADYGLLRLDEGVDAKGEFNRRPAILLNAHREFGRLIQDTDPDWVIAEIPHLRGGSSFLTVALFGVAQMLTAQHQAGFYGVHTATWQSRIIPKQKGDDSDTKDRSLAHVRSLRIEPESDDVADAICIAEYAHNELEFGGVKVPFVVDPQFARAA